MRKIPPPGPDHQLHDRIAPPGIAVLFFAVWGFSLGFMFYCLFLK